MNETKQTEAAAPEGRLDALVGRLRDHAEMHSTIAWQDDEQRQWMDDLWEAAAELERLKELERRVAKRCADAVPQWAPELRELLTPNA